MFRDNRRDIRWAFTPTATSASAPLSSAVVVPSDDPFTVEAGTVTMAAMDLFAWEKPPASSRPVKLARPRN